MRAQTLMIQGTASYVGKSVLTAALCSYFRQQGLSVAPFKSQTMSNNSHVTKSGGEIGRAQAFQAEACGIDPTIEMNPILLKPCSETGSQVVVLGKPVGTMTAREYHRYQPQLIPTIQSAFESLASQYDVIVLEGAGSPAEVNLHKFDIVNMAMAKIAQAPVILVGDIHAGGVFASLVGTLELLPADERKLVKALIINKFRGDPSLLDEGLSFLEKKTSKTVLGVLPFVPNLEIDEEDGVSTKHSSASSQQDLRALNADEKLNIVAIQFPRISNSTDFVALAGEPDVKFRYITRPPAENEPLPDAVILPGTKSTIADLQFLRTTGLATYLQNLHTKKVSIIGICGGFQMLGTTILDPEAAESPIPESKGLAFLPVVTRFAPTKKTVQIRALSIATGTEVAGYEIHMGQTTAAVPTQSAVDPTGSDQHGSPLNLDLRPAFQITEEGGAAANRFDGCISVDGKTWGTYIHGLFDSPNFLRHFLNDLRHEHAWPALPDQPRTPRQLVFHSLANLIRSNLDCTKLTTMLHSGVGASFPRDRSNHS